MKFNDIPKFVVNLERRPDRLERVKELYGFATYDYRWPEKHVYFFWED